MAGEQEGVRDGAGFVEHRDRRGVVREELGEGARFGERNQRSRRRCAHRECEPHTLNSRGRRAAARLREYNRRYAADMIVNLTSAVGASTRTATVAVVDLATDVVFLILDIAVRKRDE